MTQFEENYRKLLDVLSPDKEDSLFHITMSKGFSIGDDISVHFTQHVKVEHRENGEAVAIHHDPAVTVFLIVCGKPVKVNEKLRKEPITQVIGEPVADAVKQYHSLLSEALFYSWQPIGRIGVTIRDLASDVEEATIGEDW